MKSSQKGLTLIELMIIVAFIGIVIAIALPIFQGKYSIFSGCTVTTNNKTYTSVPEDSIRRDGSRIYFKSYNGKNHDVSSTNTDINCQ